MNEHHVMLFWCLLCTVFVGVCMVLSIARITRHDTATTKVLSIVVLPALFLLEIGNLTRYALNHWTEL